MQPEAMKRTDVELPRRTRLNERGLGPHGGAWNVAQAAAWCGIGENQLREKAKRDEIPNFKIGRRIVIPRQAFMDWFNRGSRRAL